MSILDIPVKSLSGQDSSLGSAAPGAALLVVNVASKCGLTPQYTALEKLHEQFAARGLSVVGFPCNQFGGQEPGTAGEIAEFCSATYDVTFPVTTKIDVNGPAADPLWVHLRRQAPGDLGPDAGILYEHLKANRPEAIGTDEVKWNFTKFLVDADGAVVRRYEPHETPEQIGAELAAGG